MSNDANLMFCLYDNNPQFLGQLQVHQIDGFAMIYNALLASGDNVALRLVDHFHDLHVRQLVEIDNLKIDLAIHRMIGHREIKRAENTNIALKEKIALLTQEIKEKDDLIAQLASQDDPNIPF